MMKREDDEEGGGGGGEEEEEEEKRKKKRQKKMEWSEIRFAIEELSFPQAKLKLDHEDDHGNLQASTLAFLAASNLLLHFLDKVGPTMAVLRHDVQRNIERLEDVYVSDPSTYSSLVEILKKEVSEGTSRKAESCSKAMLWLTRSMDFSVEVLERLHKGSELSLGQVIEEAYMTTLKPWHGWISSAAYKVALKLIPETESFISLLMGKEQDLCILKSDVQRLVSLVQPLLNEVHSALKRFRLDRVKST